MVQITDPLRVCNAFTESLIRSMSMRNDDTIKMSLLYVTIKAIQ